MEPLILLDLSNAGEFRAPLTRIIQDINRCAQRDGILVSVHRLGREHRHGTTAPLLTACRSQP
ncbi:hypothetical protein EAH80_21130 [Mycobacterium hodleri]|uniref:Uncharacterized protein n=1 Tax=Mycolicibacterium hodleri TaxID=49897 RepID=A0A502E4J3_9MYCO|nr:hypothetical protein EAH80_21130 [Mycolicibacterium hodleri]